MQVKKCRAAIALALTAGCLWGCVGLFIRGLNAGGLTGFQIVEVRLIVTTIVFAAFLFVKGRALFRVHLRDLWIFALAGGIGMLVYNACYLVTVETTTINLAAGLAYTASGFSLVMSKIAFGERINGRKIATIALILVGCLFLSDPFGGSLAATPVQILIGMGTGLGYAFYGVLSRIGLDRGYHPLTVLFYSFLAGSIACAVPCDFAGIGQAVASEPAVPWLLLAVSVFGTIVPYAFYTISLKRLELSRATMLTSIDPMVATTLAFIVFSEVPGIAQVLGVLFIVGAVLVLNVPRRNPAAVRAPKTPLRLRARAMR